MTSWVRPGETPARSRGDRLRRGVRAHAPRAAESWNQAGARRVEVQKPVRATLLPPPDAWPAAPSAVPREHHHQTEVTTVDHFQVSREVTVQ